MSKKVCEAINSANDLFKVEKNDSGRFINYNKILNINCPVPKHLNNQECVHYEPIVSSAFIALLTLFKDIDGEENIENDKLAEYAILWLGYKINQEPHEFRNLNEFYKKNIMDNEKYIVEENAVEAYKSYKDTINNKIGSKTIDIKETSKLYESFEILCKIYTTCNENNQNCEKCSKDANDFVENFQKLNEDPNHTEGSSYSQILSSLSNDYNKLKKKCDNGQSSNFPSLPEITPKKSSPQNLVESSGQTPIYNSVQVSEATTSSSSIASRLIPTLLIFAIPVFLGIAYKYSLFGFDKRLQRQYIREKIKKIKKKMNHYI